MNNKLISAPIITMPDFEKQFIIRIDTSYDGIEAYYFKRMKITMKNQFTS